MTSPPGDATTAQQTGRIIVQMEESFLWARKLRFILTPPIILAGMFVLFLPFAFASMLDGDPQNPLGRRGYLGIVFSKGIGGVSIGILLLAAGFYIAVSKPKTQASDREHAGS